MNFKIFILSHLLFACDFTTPKNNIIHDYNKAQRLVDFKTYNISIDYGIIDHSPYIQFNKDPAEYIIEMTENFENNSISVHDITFESSQAVEIANFTELSFVFNYEIEVSEAIHQDLNFISFELNYKVLGQNSYNYINPNNINQLLGETLPIFFRVRLKLSSGNISIINSPMNTAKFHIENFSIFGRY